MAFGRQHIDHFVEAAGHHGDAPRGRANGRDQLVDTGRYRYVPGHSLEHRHGETLQGRNPSAKALLEVEFAIHRTERDRLDFGEGARLGSEQLDHLILDERRIDIEQHQEAGQRGPSLNVLTG